MVSARRPSTETIRAFLASQSKLGFSYEAVGATAHGQDLPPGYMVDHARTKLGTGAEVFAKARAALDRWDQFNLGWVEVAPSGVTIEPGATVAVLARQFGLWWTSACQIVYVVADDPSGPTPTRRHGFAYGTLPDHAGTGEERFLIEWDRHTDEVWFDVLAFSRPQWFVSRHNYWYMRRLQTRFGPGSAQAMKRAVETAAPSGP
jgi:uncharacterized protein (UPF0548 family)